MVFSINAYAQSKVCNYCGEPIEGKYLVFEGKDYHEYCYRHFVLEKCAQCNEPLEGRYIFKEGKKYHEKCFHENVALKCDLCSGIINGTYINDYWGNKYHSFHIGREMRCDFCGRFISPELTRGGFKYNDGRTICRICNETAVTTLSKAESLLRKVRNSLALSGISIDYDKIDVQLVDKDELRSLTLEYNQLSDARGFAHHQYWETNGRIIRREFVIYILHGMPEKDFEAVAAHELMHVWQYLNSPKDLSLQFTEGSAEYTSYIHMKKYNDKYSGYLIHQIHNNRDRTYGEGFRRVKQMVDETSISNWLNTLRTKSDFPPGY